jgi:hypothetical protein
VGQYWCSICGRDYAQQQGFMQHYRDGHEVSLCIHCGDFECHRRNQLKENPEEQHPGVNLSAALGEGIRSRRKTTIIKNHRRRQRAPPSTIERARWVFANTRLCSSSLLPAEVVEVASISLPAMSPVCYDLQPESVE